MPIGFALSRQFYDTLGNEVANEVVAMLNTMDGAYRSENRELFNAHSGRLEARLDARMDGLEARLDARIDGLDARMSSLEERLGTRMGNLEERLSARMTSLEARLDARIESLEQRSNLQMDIKIEAAKSELIRWMFFFWVTSMGTMIALLKL